ncbi:MAG: HlyD family efflux transporter periplasmic adaptor subunit [Balneolia bacterium]|nr:HlyD family efflux transporter periplasmic adaptor subunit [Balneolia bacterium]
MNQSQNQNFDQKPVPIPPSQRWREFRIRFIPVIMFGIALIVILTLWEERVRSPDFIGRVMAPQAVITAPSDGLLTSVDVADFSFVESGMAFARINRAVPEELNARRNQVLAEIDYIRTSMYPVQTQQRSFVDYQGLRLDWMEKRLEQSALRADSVFIENEFRRTQRLFESGFVEEQVFDEVSARREVNNVSLREVTALMQDLEQQFENIGETISFSEDYSARTIDAAIQVQLAELEVIENEFGSILVSSPVSGILLDLTKSAGSWISRGDTIAVVEARESEYIVGYLRQPFSVRPEVGMKVEVRSRKVDRSRYEAEISEMGAQIRPISQDMQRPGMTFESGLPVKIKISEEFADVFYPGELVDLILQPAL